MGWLGHSPLIVLTFAATSSFAAPLRAQTVDNENCLAAEIAENRGFEAMEGLKFKDEDGEIYSLGNRTLGRPIDPSLLKDPNIMAKADKWTPGAIEYVDGWVMGYRAIGRDNKQKATQAASDFISFYIKCLDKFGPAGWR